MISLGIALTLHAILAAILATLPLIKFVKIERAIPIRLISNERVASINSSSIQKQAATEAEHSRLNTSGSSSFSTTTTKEPKTKRPVNRKQNNTVSEQIEFSVPKLSNKSRYQQAGTGLRNLFSKNETQTQNPVKQLNTQQAEKLSTYEEALIQHLSSAALYDKFHQIMTQAQSVQISYEIKLTLFANGAIRSARMTQPSGIEKIDALAITSAYNASPFPRPPSDDITKNYQYVIPMSYQP